MNLLLKYIIIHLASWLYKILWIFPIKPNTILFVSYGGSSLSCNPYYLYKYIKEHGSEFNLYWLLDKNISVEELSNSEIIRKGGIKSLLMIATVKFVITNDRLPSYISFRKQQCLINTWHGGGAFKKIFRNQKGIIKWYTNQMNLNDASRTSCYLSTSMFFSNVLVSTFQYNGLILPTGFPRNDIFFDVDRKQILKHKIKNKLCIPLNDDIILYAPTFRGNPNSASMEVIQKNPIDVEMLKTTWEYKNGKHCHFLFRAHHTMRKGLGIANIIDVTDYHDMQELLLISDALVTDYSSCIWDYSLSGRPCFMYAPDFEQYVIDPGFESDYRKWPVILTKSNSDLKDKILNLDMGDYAKKIKEYHQLYQSYETGHACQKVYEFIKNRTLVH